MKELILVRHGEADHMVTDLTGGWSDTHLTDLGRRQAAATGDCLADLLGDKPFRFCSSDLARAVETADIIASSLCLRPSYISGLREINNGAAANLTMEEAAAISIPMTHPAIDWVPYPGAESWGAMSHRVESFLESIRSDQDALTILVLHGGSGNAAICWWLGLEIGQHNITFELEACSISTFSINRFDRGEYRERSIVKLNDTTHLAPLTMTTSNE